MSTSGTYWNIAEKDFVSREFWSRFFRNLLVDWIESRLNNISPPSEKHFFQWRQAKGKRVWSLHRISFSTLIASNARVTLSLTEVKNTQKTHECPKKRQITVHSVRTQFRNRKCSAKWLFRKIRKNVQKNIRVDISFLILLIKTLHQGCFFAIFSNILEHLRTFSFLQKQPSTEAVTKTLKKSCTSCLLNKIVG